MTTASADTGPARLAAARLRGVLTSQGEPTTEAWLRLADGATGVASCPIAIAPGRRERARSGALGLGPLDGRLDTPATTLVAELTGTCFTGQRDFDAVLTGLAHAARFGANITLPLSVAFCKACASSRGMALHDYLAELAGTKPGMPALLVNVFSGGIHGRGRPDTFQQIMVVIDGGTATDRVRDALTLFAMIEDRYAGRHAGYSASSGLLVTGHDTGELLAELRGQLDSAGMRHAIGVDVAAEHLRSPAGRYRFEGAELPGADLAERLEAQVRRYGIGYLEDPFDAADEDLWRELTRRLNGVADVVGDDLFATDAERLRPGLAHAIVVKMTQIGTVSGTLTAAARARRLGMSGCVSHRSGETEDTAMCDLAVGLGARYIKVGGPRRGDRTAKYNQLLRLGEAL